MGFDFRNDGLASIKQWANMRQASGCNPIEFWLIGKETNSSITTGSQIWNYPGEKVKRIKTQYLTVGRLQVDPPVGCRTRFRSSPDAWKQECTWIPLVFLMSLLRVVQPRHPNCIFTTVRYVNPSYPYMLCIIAYHKHLCQQACCG